MAKRVTKPKLVITWDTETFKTLDLDGSTLVKPYLVGGGCNGEFFYSFEPHTDFFKFLSDRSKIYNLELWAHNANYDLTALYPEYLSKYIEDHKIIWRVSENKRFISFHYKATRKLSFKVYDSSIGNPHRLSLNEWLKAIGKPQKIEGFHYEKGDLTRDNDTFTFKDNKDNILTSSIADELRYLRRDVEGLMDVIQHQLQSKKYLYDLFELRYPSSGSTTSASFGKTLIDTTRHNYFFNSTYRPTTDMYDFYRAQLVSSCGGFTACNTKYQEYYSKEALIKSYDINSCYPCILATGIPSGEVFPEKIGAESVTGYECHLTECEGIEKYAFISTLPIPKKGCTLGHEVFILKEYYDLIRPLIKSDIEIVDTGYQPLNYELTKIVKKLYKEKVEIDKEPDSFNKSFKKDNIKLLLNSLYGKLAEKTYTEDTYYNQTIKDFQSERIDVHDWSYTLSGVYVVQKARAYLIRNIIREIDQGNIFLYADTDSIKLVEFKPVLFTIHPYRLGAFKSENFENNEGYTHFLSTGKIKKYLMYHEDKFTLKKGLKMALSGVSKKVQTELLMYAPINLLRALFNPLANICIINGKLSNKRNKGGQVILNPLDICLNGQNEEATNKIFFDPVTLKGYET